MSAAIIILMFLLGLVLVIKGGDLFVDAASWLAEISGIPKFLIGATIVSLATTLPELLVSLMAAASGSIGIAAGNAVGSVTANIGLIMGISVVCLPTTINRRDQAFKFIMMAGAIVLLFTFSSDLRLNLPGSTIMLGLFVLFMAESILSAREHMRAGADEPRLPANRRSLLINGIKFISGVAGIVVGADLMVDYGAMLARLFGVPESIVGATLVAVGTSLPELATTLTALAKKQAALSIGNIIGANIIDLTLILPLCAIVAGKPLPLLRQNIALDMPFCMILVFIAVLPGMATGRFHRSQGILMLAVYAVYVALLLMGAL